ncbi:MAG: hypothetical protein AVDCRST_MAG57-1336 [uncultured Blastococcus sp.]|uniref:Uncharacterized protein n=1 Tax=uncultured Blastococcus sp. TaxID=217144 RepID=A0A6J4HZ92_9ACTN|nr:MAG: hypothetical protein AVDCRST_MAG57-1336 [uncultured Blastococcus sp.]
MPQAPTQPRSPSPVRELRTDADEPRNGPHDPDSGSSMSTTGQPTLEGP